MKFGSNESTLIASPPFTVICGIDGCGKTTVIEKLKLIYSGCKFTHWSTMSSNRVHNEQLKLYIDPEVIGYNSNLPPMSRALYISSIVWAEYEYLIRPGIEQGCHIVSDSYYLKFWAKEQAFNRAHPVLYSLLSQLPMPDKVIFIDTKPTTVLTRRDSFSTYESQGPKNEDFVKFQIQVRKNMLELLEQHKFVWINGEQSADSVLTEVIKALANRSSTKRGNAVRS